MTHTMYRSGCHGVHPTTSNGCHLVTPHPYVIIIYITCIYCRSNSDKSLQRDDHVIMTHFSL